MGYGYHRHYTFREANSSPRVELDENCELNLRNRSGQISGYILVPNGGYSGPHFGLVTMNI